jgi:hypothetical protein
MRPRQFIALLLLLLAACGEHSRGTSQMTNREIGPIVTVRVGEAGAEFSHRYAGQVHLVHQPAGIDFYVLDWDRPPYPAVKVDAGSHSFTIPNVIGIQGQQDLDEVAEGLSEFSVYARVTPAGQVTHDEARVVTYGLLREIRNAGWQSVIDPGAPRLSGRERLGYALSRNKYVGLDPNYDVTLAEWMQIENRTPWFFHAPGNFLEVSFQRESSLMQADKVGAYLLTFVLKSDAEYFRSYVDSDERAQWRAALPGILQKLALTRSKKEVEQAAMGKVIDQRYVDPIPAIAAEATR